MLTHSGLALASSLSACGNMLLLIYLLRRKIGSFGGKKLLQAALKGICAALPAGAAAMAALQFADWSHSGEKLFKGGVLIAAILAAVSIYSLLSLLFRSEEAKDAATLLKRKLLKCG